MVILQVSRLSFLGLLLVLGMAMIGCGSSDGDPNYSTEIKMTEEQKAKEAEELKHRPPPGTVSDKVGVPRAEPNTMKFPGGKH